MAQTNTVTTLNGFFKHVYGDSLKDLIPNWAIVQQDIGFSAGDSPGLDWKIPVITQMEQGVTYMAPNAGRTALSAPVAGATVELTVKGYQQVLAAELDFEAAFNAARSEAAFKRTTAHIVESMWASARKRLEIDLLYGGGPLGIIASKATHTLTITDATWAPGIWAGMEGASLYACDSLFAGPTMVATPITKVDLANKAITVLDSTTAAATNYLFLDNQVTALTNEATSTFRSMRGINRILTHASADANDTTFFGTHNFLRTLLQGFTVSAGSTDLSFGTIQDALAKAQARGADSDFILYVSPATWANLMNDQSALRRYDASYTTGKQTLGAKSIEYWGPYGKVTIKSHPMVWEGSAYGITPSLWKRIGSTDITFSRPDLGGKADGNSFFLEMEGYNTIQLRCYSNQALFTYAPARNFIINLIVNS